MDNNTPTPEILNDTEFNETNEIKDIQEPPAPGEVEAEGEDRAPKKKERRKLSYYFTGGMIMAWLTSLTECVYAAFADGFFGRIFIYIICDKCLNICDIILFVYTTRDNIVRIHM